jgi:hypothetical protein
MPRLPIKEFLLMTDGHKKSAMVENSSHLTHRKYYPDIDGLRATAILTVAGFNAFPNWVHGGISASISSLAYPAVTEENTT